MCRVIVSGFRKRRTQELIGQQMCSGFDRLSPLVDFGAASSLSQFLHYKSTQQGITVSLRYRGADRSISMYADTISVMMFLANS